jgi:N-acylneuraminate cytidylyltransferase
MSNVAFIFARGGSKGLPNKNVLDFFGKPLIAWSIEQALAVKRIDRLIVSTDSQQIAKIARNYGAEVPFIRPAELATDMSSEILSWKHGLNYLKETTGEYPEVFLSIPSTAPLRLSSDIDLCLDEFLSSNPDIVVTVTDSHRNPYFNILFYS